MIPIALVFSLLRNYPRSFPSVRKLVDLNVCVQEKPLLPVMPM